MANYLPLIILIILAVIFLLWVWKGSLSKERLRESLFRNVGVPYRNLIGLLLGITASLLSLAGSTWTIGLATWVFVVAVVVMMILLVVVRPSIERELDRFAWGLLAIIVLGFGLGALIYQARPWWIWLWRQYLRINEPHELVLEFLFILGVILGVFVVRNWGKEQKAFTESLTGILGGTFVAAIFGETLKEQGLTPIRALTYYGLGFVMSAALNLLVAALLTANYTNKRSKASRAILDFLYGSERAKVIDGYFLQNFKEDPDYAKRLLTAALLEYRKLVGREFAKRMDDRRILRLTERNNQNEVVTTEQSTLCKEFWSKQQEEIRLRSEVGTLTWTSKAKAEKEQDQERLDQLRKEIKELKRNLRRPSYYYQLISIGCDAKQKGGAENVSKFPDPADQDYEIVYKRLEPSKREINQSKGFENDHTTVARERSAANHSDFEMRQRAPRITEEMFRVGILLRTEDVLDYIVAPGPYRAAFRYFGSVAGLSLLTRQTIIMNRDRTKRFRAKDYRDGICPRDVEQWRGLDEIDYLSYISIPVVSRLGSSQEAGIGVINIDTRLFVTQCELPGELVNASESIFRTRLTPGQLTEFAVNLYEENDRDVESPL